MICWRHITLQHEARKHTAEHKTWLSFSRELAVGSTARNHWNAWGTFFKRDDKIVRKLLFTQATKKSPDLHLIQANKYNTEGLHYLLVVTVQDSIVYPWLDSNFFLLKRNLCSYTNNKLVILMVTRRQQTRECGSFNPHESFMSIDLCYFFCYNDDYILRGYARRLERNLWH